ncbi:MAG TPA: BadF/BadG/BcrA/BcrD ATPase family protein [Roseiflexaceae bacterium]|jgi:N-acetylglucosamine kinase-like BadF-type ATPase|nr:BadF/BadG/BcrA/BcrD ATPase family protein [Roseiflexaceae bacterium]
MNYVLGVDAGNTKTIALVARGDGTIVGAGRGGCGDIYGAGTARALAEVERAVRAALAAGGVQLAHVVSAAFSMAGADWPEDFALLEGAMHDMGFGRSITVVNDALGALWAGAPDGPAVSVVCGTGIAIAARGSDGQVWHGSFWLEALGADELGRKTLRAIYRTALGIDPPTSLTAGVLDLLGAASVEEVLHLFTARGQARPEKARQLARLLLDEASHGDATARRIVQEHGAALGDYALAAARQAGIDQIPFTLVLAGGVLRHPSRLLHDSLIARVRTTAPDVQAVNSRFEPVVGALVLALESAHRVIDTALITRLTASLPPAALFETLVSI